MAAKTITMTITTRMIMVMIRKLEVIQYIWNLRLYEEVGGCTLVNWRLYIWNLRLYEEVGGCAQGSWRLYIGGNIYYGLEKTIKEM